MVFQNSAVVMQKHGWGWTLGIGAVKAGSTSIYHYLGEHPDVYVSPVKETNFFAYEGQTAPRFRIQTWSDYAAQFARVGGERAVGEFSPIYMEHPRAAQRIADALPAVKLIASLRSPVDRAYSGWVGSIRQGIEREPAELAIRPGSRYIERGRYGVLLRPYFELFERERIKLLLFEDLAANPARAMSEIYEFLGVDPSFVPDVSRRHNAASVPKYPRLNYAWQALRRMQPRGFCAPEAIIRWNRRLMESTYTAPPPIDAGLRARLLELYRDEIGRVEDLLGRDLEAWRR